MQLKKLTIGIFKMKKYKRKLDRRTLGVILGVVFPIIGALVFWQWSLNEKSFQELIHFIGVDSTLRDNYLIFSMLPNLILFYFSNFRLKWEHMSLGLVVVSIIYVVLITALIFL